MRDEDVTCGDLGKNYLCTMEPSSNNLQKI